MMKTVSRMLVLGTAMVTAHSLWAAPPVCPPVLDGLCDNPNYQFCPIVTDAATQGTACEKGGPGGESVGELNLMAGDPIPAGYVQVVCDYTGGGYHCEAWPKSPAATYAWTKGGNVQWVNAPYLDDKADVTCGPGINNRVNMTITTPYGLSFLDTMYIYCGYAGEY